MKRTTHLITLTAASLGLVTTSCNQTKTVDLLKKYPTSLTAGLLQPDQAQPWQFNAADVFQLSRFGLQVGDNLKIDIPRATLGIGHCEKGAVWAVVLPVSGGELTKPNLGAAEQIAHVWLRFHPGQINKLFPPTTVSAVADGTGANQIRTIAESKFSTSYHAGANALIPEPKDMTVRVETQSGLAKFFIVDTQAQTAQTTPTVIATNPLDGANDVDPRLTEITVTFDQDMSQGMSWTGNPAQVPPPRPGAKASWRDPRTCVLPVSLQSSRHYVVGINSPNHRGFRNVAGQPADPTSLSFTTR